MYVQIFPDTILNALAHIRTGPAKFFSVHYGYPLTGSCSVCFLGVYLCVPAATAFSNYHRFHDITPLFVYFLSSVNKISSNCMVVNRKWQKNMSLLDGFALFDCKTSQGPESALLSVIVEYA
jgi:hypothetical protein